MIRIMILSGGSFGWVSLKGTSLKGFARGDEGLWRLGCD